MIEIPADVVGEVLAHAAKEYPNEACGLLAGTVTSDGPAPTARSGIYYPMANADASPVTYRLDAQEQFVREPQRHIGHIGRSEGGQRLRGLGVRPARA